VLSKLDVKIHTSTPPERRLELPDPWVSKTPTTILETESQSEYTERRIRRHKSSSPASIIEGLKSISKGFLAIQHRVAFIEAENRELRATNNILSRRQREKKTRLRNGGTIE
jgi:hypothetical protein